MNQSQYNQLFSFIWNIANDVLVHAFEKSEYKKIILPFMVLRRIDVLLEPTKKAVMERKKFCDDAGLTNYDPFLMPITGYPFYNTSNFTLQTLKAEIDPLRLKMNFIDYMNGFSADVQDIIEKFKLRQQVDNLTDTGRLGSIIEKFTDTNINLSVNPIVDDKGKVILPGLDNHTMGTIFEELLRKFNEENAVTEAGEHFTPRDYVRLLGELAVIPVADKIVDNTYTIYDGASGTGGILTIAQDEIKRVAKERGKKVNIQMFGQEIQPDTYATCKADMMISGEVKSFKYTLNGNERQFIGFGSTISQDGHPGESYDFCISNPPFGTPWKEDLKNLGLDEKKKDEFIDPRFWNGAETFLPGIGDCQMLFLANNVSRMKNTPMGTRIVEVHNGSSLFTGKAGGGESNLRKYIIENDMLEAIVAMPENDFYNTGIGTYIWIVTNRKEERRKGKVQLIDATAIKHPLRKNLGSKNCETNAEDRKAILKLLTDFEENEQSKIFPNEEFGYQIITLERPLRKSVHLDKESLGEVVKNAKAHNVKFSESAIKALAAFGIDASYKDDTPVVDNLSEVFSDKYKNVRAVKLPRTIGQLKADEGLSIAMEILCQMAAQQTLYLDYNKFVKAFNENKAAKDFKLKFSNVESFFYAIVNINPEAEPVVKNGMYVPDPALRDTEQVPLTYPGGVKSFMGNEVLPYVPDAWVDDSKTVLGYELSFTKYFYKPVKLRSLEEISAEIKEIEARTDGMLNEILGL